MPTLSLCMIVRNEAEHLPRCLESVKNWVDEIIVVDTGSTDNTMEIALGFGAQVFQHLWENDFSKHRNQSISYAKCDWIFWIDADEELQQRSGPLLRETISRDGIDSLLVTLVNFFNGKMSRSLSNQVRIFKNHMGIHFRGIVHNMPHGYTNTLPCPIYIDHYGYDLSPEKMKAKFLRTSQLLKQKITDNPGDFKPVADLAVSYSMAEMYEDSIREGVRAIHMARQSENKGGVLVLWTYYIVASSYLKLRDYANAETYALEALGLNPNHLDSHFIMAMVAHQTRAWETLESAAGHYLEILEWVTGHPEQSGYTVNNTANEGWRILLALGHSKLARGYPELAQEFFSQAISVAPNSVLCHQMIAEFSLNCGSLEMAERHYRETIAKDPGRLDALLGLAKTCSAGGRVQECRDLMALLRSRDPQDTEMINEIGVSDLMSGDYESAIKVFERAVAQSPGQANLHINLALAYRKSSMTEKAIESNLNALRLNRNAQEALINLGNIYYEQGRFEEALPLFEKALDHDPTLLEVSLRLAWARLLGGNVVGCIQGCDALLKTLERPVDLLIHDLNDLAKVFLELARGFKEEGRELPSGEALEMAQQLNPGALNLEAQGH